MIRLRKIIAPVDFSESSKKAVNYALSLALQFDARLILAHVVPYDAGAYEQAKADLLALIPPDCRERINFEIIVKSGDVRGELIGIIEDKEIDLAVMGTRGRSYFERMFLGSVTDRLLRKLHVPILTVSHLDPEREIHPPAPVSLQRILYATDLADGSKEGLEFAIRFAHGLDAALTVAHVVRVGDVYSGIETAVVPADYPTDIRGQAEEALDRMVALTSDGSVPIGTVVAEGVPHEIINRLAGQYNADLIVLNLQNKGLLERAVLGATAERVIRTASIPVLSLPMPAIYGSRWEAA